MKRAKKELNYLEMTPFRLYEHETKENGLIDVLVPKFTSKFMVNLISKRISKPYIKANLDELGTAVWKLLDGETKVTAIAEKLSNELGDKIQPVHGRLTAFLTQLYQAGFINFKELERK